MWQHLVPPKGLVVDGYYVTEVGSVALMCS